MVTNPIRASVEAVRSWSWTMRDAWIWLTECQQMRDLLDDPLRKLAPEAFAQFLSAYDFKQHEWFLEHYYHSQIPPTGRIDWEALRARWIATDPAHTLIPSPEDRARCLTNRWHEYSLVFQGTPLSINAPSEDDYEAWEKAGGGGWVYWRGKFVEHYTYPYEQLGDARELSNVCLYLETLGVPVNVYTARHHLAHFLDMEPGNPYIPVLPHLLCYEILEAQEQIAFTHLFDCRDEKGVVHTLYFDGRIWHKVRSYSDEIEPWQILKRTYECDPFDHRAMALLGWKRAQMGQGDDVQIHAPVEGICTWLQTHTISPLFFDAQGGPWCAFDDAVLCSGCAGQIRRATSEHEEKRSDG